MWLWAEAPMGIGMCSFRQGRGGCGVSNAEKAHIKTCVANKVSSGLLTWVKGADNPGVRSLTTTMGVLSFDQDWIVDSQ